MQARNGAAPRPGPASRHVKLSVQTQAHDCYYFLSHTIVIYSCCSAAMERLERGENGV